MSDSTAKPISALTDDERAAYEREVLTATERAMSRPEHGFPFEHRAAQLADSYPNTEIVVRFWDPRFSRETERRYRIWKALVDEVTEIPEPPVRAAVLIKTWALGG